MCKVREYNAARLRKNTMLDRHIVNCATKLLITAVLIYGIGGLVPVAAGQWPYPIPCRVKDGPNRDLFVMTLGDVQTQIADGVFDSVLDRVTLKDGTVLSNYYREILGVKYYRPIDKSRFPVPPSGWCSWYYYYTRINETEVQRNAAWIAANLKDYGARYVQIDDGWQGSGARGSARNWEAVNTNRFPNGMAALASYIRSLGLTAGIWLAPHGQNNDEVVAAHPGVFMLKPDGTTASDTWEGRFLVDPTHTNSLAHLSNLFNKLVSWGYDYFKIDGQPIVVNEYRTKTEFMHNPTADAETLYRNTLLAIRSAIGPDRYLLGCWGIPLEGVGIMNGSRTGGDVVIGWGGFMVALRATMRYYFMHNIVWYTDPDVMLLRWPLTLEQARAWATLQGLTGQALLSSDLLVDLPDERVELMRRVYPAVDIRPLDLFPAEHNKRIWDLKVHHLGRSYDVVGVFNFGTRRTAWLHLRWADLGLPPGTIVHVFDFWAKEYLGAWAEGMVAEVPPTACRVLTLLPCDGRIQLISTSRHITQGWVDLVKLSWDETRNTCTGTSKVIRNDPYELRFVFPRGTNFVIAGASARAASGELPVRTVNHQGWAVVQITAPQTTEVTWEVKFAPASLYHFPPSEPDGLRIERVELDGVNLQWREQYYLNVGYHVYLDGQLLGYTPAALFPIRGLDPRSNYTVQVKSVWSDGAESARAAELTFKLADLLPQTIQLTELTPVKINGRWLGFGPEDEPSPAVVSLGARHFEHVMSAVGDAEAEYDVKGLYDRFTAEVGVPDNAGENVTVELVVYGDGNELWRSSSLKKSDGPRAVEVDIRGAARLTVRITVQDGRDRNRWQPRAVLVNPTISKRAK